MDVKNKAWLEKLFTNYHELHKLHNEQQINLRKLVKIHEKKIDELTKQVNHLRLNLRDEYGIKIPKVIK